MIPRELETQIRTLAKEANALRVRMAAMSDAERFKMVKGLVDAHRVAIGIYPDADEPLGVGAHIIKGVNILADIAMGDKAVTLDVVAIPCIELEQAIAAADVWGEKRH
ncbi:hypothetical protein AMST5_00983 [freshwater sediment metagenome]|uniref:Uncharacterized protein n=1 Tax=freshwater sediment metagenome TaxID=556182 RepID=A0AA48LXW3_9ZZZZ